MLLLHEFHARKFLLPDKLSARERERQAKRAREAAGEDGPDDYEEVKPGAFPLSAAQYRNISCSPLFFKHADSHTLGQIWSVMSISLHGSQPAANSRESRKVAVRRHRARLGRVCAFGNPPCDLKSMSH